MFRRIATGLAGGLHLAAIPAGTTMAGNPPMCPTCGWMRAHGDVAKPYVNITYEVVKRAADANAMMVDAMLAVIARTAARDRGDDPAEYPAEMAPHSQPA